MALKLGSNLDLAKVVKSLGQKYKLVPHLDLAIGENDFNWHFDYKPKMVDDAWHPSGDCTPSLRELYLKASGQLEPQSIGVSLRKTFMVGHFWHQYLQWIVHRRLEFCEEKAIERRGCRVWGEPKETHTKEDLYFGRVADLEPIEDHPEVRAWPDTEDGRRKIQPQAYHWATGSGDIAPCVIPGHGIYAIDFKTMNARMFTSGPSADYVAKWECQGNIYLDFFGLERMIIVGVCKDSPHDMKEWEFERNQPLIDAIDTKWQLVSECLDEGVEPPEGEDIVLPLQGPVGT